MKGKFGSADYAEEELVAERGSAFLMADLGIVGKVQHESYIASWLQTLKNDKRYVFKATSAASKAHRYLIVPVFGVMISVLRRVIHTCFIQERNHDRETTQHAERDHDSRACLTGKSA